MYKIANDRDFEKLEVKVNELIELGFVPIGTLFKSAGIYFQAMFKIQE